MRKVINWTPERLEKLRAAHKGCGGKKFEIAIEGVKAEFDPGYAKYLIEHLDNEFAKRGVAPQPQNTGEESTSASSTDGSL